MRTRENEPSLKNKSCDVRSVDLADFDDESRAAALEQIERHHACIKEQKRLMRDLMRVTPSVGTQILGQLVAICDTDRAARLEVLRGIRDALGDAKSST
jgi:hypothetical protein